MRTSIIKLELGLDVISVVPKLTKKDLTKSMSNLERRMANSLSARKN
jgi:hypothetical protein